MPGTKTTDHPTDQASLTEDESERTQPSKTHTDSPPAGTGPGGWETYLNKSAVEIRPENPPGTGWYRTAIACAVLGLIIPILLGPTAVTMGLIARDKNHPRAFVPIILGIAVTVYGIVYYRLAAAGVMR